MTTKAQRNQALTEAAASLRIEGGAFSKANEDVRQAWADGRIDGGQARKALLERATGKKQAAA